MKPFQEKKKSFMSGKTLEPLCFSKLFVISRRLKVIEVKKFILRQYLPIMRLPKSLTDEMDKQQSEERKVDLAYTYFFEKSKKDDQPYKLLIENNIMQDSFSFTKKKCEFCGNSHKDHCEFVQDGKSMDDMNRLLR